jgi:hypothetical protein
MPLGQNKSARPLLRSRTPFDANHTNAGEPLSRRTGLVNDLPRQLARIPAKAGTELTLVRSILMKILLAGWQEEKKRTTAHPTSIVLKSRTDPVTVRHHTEQFTDPTLASGFHRTPQADVSATFDLLRGDDVRVHSFGERLDGFGGFG